ncbi:MAG TPA: GGDEF domain-containing phosphodiesterase, partial [Solirubrobacteraceae bacterium]|nr:GGDEF domain-containing phosphodiesterase [Solirubrobacteraceae bacterium]
RLLQAVAERLRAALGAGELLARLSADEFAVLLPDGAAGDEAGALTRAGAFLAALGEPVALDARTVRVAATAGVWTSTPGTPATADEALSGADLALDRGKRAARGNAVAYRPEMHAAARELLQLEHELREAIERGELVPHFQPLFRQDGVALGAEALVRWEHPTRGLLGPGAFLDLAERSGLIVPIGRQILRGACTLAAGWGAVHPEAAEVGVGVNVAAAQLADPGFPAEVEAVLADTGLHPNRLILELTESAMMADMDGAVATLGRLREVGVRVAIDDFGTGYSSLAYLHRLPLDYLKIPREFVAALDAEDERDAHELTRVIAELARSLGLRVVAEGVETPAQQAAVEEIGCFLVQGFLHARPVPGDEIEALVARTSTGSNRRVASVATRL